MTGQIPYLDKKALIHGELLKLAKARPLRTVTYKDFGARFRIPAQGPWKVLDLIADEDVGQELPDVTYLVINKKTGYPSKIDGKKAKAPSAGQKARAKVEGQKIVAKYNPGAANPF